MVWGYLSLSEAPSPGRPTLEAKPIESIKAQAQSRFEAFLPLLKLGTGLVNQLCSCSRQAVRRRLQNHNFALFMHPPLLPLCRPIRPPRPLSTTKTLHLPPHLVWSFSIAEGKGTLEILEKMIFLLDVC